MISENESLENLRSASNLRKISVPAHLIFFSVCHLNFFLIYTIDLKKIQVTNWKKIQVFRNWNFSKVWSRPSQDLHFQKSRYRLNVWQFWVSEKSGSCMKASSSLARWHLVNKVVQRGRKHPTFPLLFYMVNVSSFLLTGM